MNQHFFQSKFSRLTRSLSRLFLPLSLALTATTTQAAVDAQLLAAATATQPALIATLEQLVSIESGSGQLDGLARMASVLEGRLQALGMTTRRHKTTAGAGADVVIGSMTGTGRRRVLMMGHMDTVYQAGILNTQPFKREGNKLYGPGIADDKGGIAVILHALKILGDAGWKDFDQITVLFNPDEEVGSVGSGELIAEMSDQHEIVLSFEPTSTREHNQSESLLLGAAGTAAATLTVKGRASHAGVSPELGRNAIIEISHQMIQTKDVAASIPGTQMNWTNVISNKATNQIPELATARADVRLTIPGAEKPLLTALQAKVAGTRLVPDTESNIQLVIGRPAFRAGAAGKALAEKAQQIYREIDRSLVLVPMIGGATDAAFAGRSGKATVVESFGLAGFGYHARDEYIDIESIVPRLYLTTRLLVDLGKGI
ncbi:MAG: M20/M25/M40 family metallo-hydrolase [Betaproteobacteria bacterium]|jgi:glutamate carboxypeptidase|nr:M20/M25/M40 family metallo-hydrolase [Betaproteobacteria bacterium]